MDSDSWDDLDMRAASQIRLLLAKNVLANQEKEALSLTEVTGALLSEEKERNKGAGGVDLGLYVGEKKKKNVCWKCGQSGHLRRDCKGKGNGAGSANGPNQYANHVETIGSDDGEVLLTAADFGHGKDWILDSGATRHMCAHRSYFDKCVGCGGGVVLTGDGSELSMKGVGEIRIRMFDDKVQILQGVQHVSGLSRNLISLSQLDSNGLEYSYSGGVLKVYRGATVIMKGSLSRGLYTLVKSEVGGVTD
ncbi:zinc finger protein [Macleaya cordata]|uniref:Zinc finger protein n=1 Tax=Macleaya cordata TaxID=56857 RepID=A0A200Q8D0_MACCD|nr:zinc finger protein [Macleaya cordata]